MTIEKWLLEAGLLVKNQKTIDLRQFTKARSYKAIIASDLDDYNLLIIFRDAKSRLLKSEVLKIFELANMICQNENIKFKYKWLFYNSQICSKAKEELKEAKWKSNAAL